MRPRIGLLLLFVFGVPSPALAQDTLKAVLHSLEQLEQEVRQVEPGDGHAVGRLQASAKSVLARLEFAERFDQRTAKAGQRMVLELARILQAKDEPGNLPIAIADPPRRDLPPPTFGQSPSDKTTRQRLDAIRERYYPPLRRLHAGRQMAFTLEHAMLLAKETARFVQEFRQLTRQLQADRHEVRSMPTTSWTEGGRWNLDADLHFAIPDGINSEIWRSRWYLRAACHGALTRAKEELGLVRRVVVNTGGRPAIEWERGATIDDMLQFANRAALVGEFFEEGIDGDPSQWLKTRKEIEGLARSRGLKLER